MTIRTEITTVTPDHAATLLKLNTSNRKVSARNMAKVKEALVSGEWKLNGEAVKIAKDGRVLDGQHRLSACVETGIPFESIIVHGLADDTQETMDSGKSRTPADALSLRGYKNSTILAAIAGAVIKSEKHSTRAAFTNSTSYAVTTPQIVGRVEAEPWLEELALESQRYRVVGLAGRTAGALLYLLTTIDADDADYFFDRLHSGTGLSQGGPILTLRNSLIGMKQDRGSKSQTHIAAIAIKAWNKYRNGDSCSMLRFTPGGANPEKFPEPI